MQYYFRLIIWTWHDQKAVWPIFRSHLMFSTSVLDPCKSSELKSQPFQCKRCPIQDTHAYLTEVSLWVSIFIRPLIRADEVNEFFNDFRRLIWCFFWKCFASQITPSTPFIQIWCKTRLDYQLKDFELFVRVY